jgi:hypothetical protein
MGRRGKDGTCITVGVAGCAELISGKLGALGRRTPAGPPRLRPGVGTGPRRRAAAAP